MIKYVLIGYLLIGFTIAYKAIEHSDKDEYSEFIFAITKTNDRSKEYIALGIFYIFMGLLWPPIFISACIKGFRRLKK